jgi:hypothetical protein
MSNLILALISVAIILGAITAFAEGSLNPQGALTDSFKKMEQKTGDAARTAMSSVSANAQLAGTRLDWRIRNSGQAKLRDLTKWDVVARYHGPGSTQLQVQRFTYTTSNPPAAGQWTVTDIFASTGAGAEIYEPGIVNPGEEFNVRVTFSPAIGSPTSNSVTLAVENGVSVSAAFTN